MDELLTVVIPVYNGEKYLRSTLESVLSSIYRNIEVLVINDGSSDASEQIIYDFIQIDDRIRYIYEENSGIVVARNRGLELAKGEYICFCDQDDIVVSDMYTEIISGMEKSNAQIGISSTGRLVSNNKSRYESLKDDSYMGKEIMNSLLYPILFLGYSYEFVGKDNYLYGSLWKCIFRKNFLQQNQIKFHRFVSYEDDWIFVTETLAKADNVISRSMTGYYWRVNEISESNAAKYVDNILEKLNELDTYTDGYLQPRMCIEQWDSYKCVRTANHIMEYLTNAWNGRKEKHIDITEEIQQLDLEKGLRCLKYFQKKSIRKRITLCTLKVFGVKAAYYINGILLWGERVTTRNSVLVRLERTIKLK